MPHLGRYVTIIHFYQPMHPAFLAQVFVDGGHLWPGELHGAGPQLHASLIQWVTGTLLSSPPGVFRASFCPHELGCQDQVIAEDQAEFETSTPEVAVTVKVPEGKSLVLVRSPCPSARSPRVCLGQLFSVSIGS